LTKKTPQKVSFLSEAAVWPLSDAKARLSELVENASHTPQVIARHGNPSVIVVSVDRYKELVGRKESLWDFFRNSPLVGLDLDLERSKDPGRDIDL
jgi:antitoxin Phd